MSASPAWGTATHVGRVREHNEDSLFAGERLWLVADGMGGHAAGDVASRIVVETLGPLDARSDLRADDLVKAIRACNDRILAHGDAHPDARGLGTTVTGLAVVADTGTPTWAVFNVGDSRVYRFADGRLERSTVDHSEAEELVQAGIITAEQARTHRLRNIVTRALGQPQAPLVDLALLPVSPGERFVACSDGLNAELTDPEIAALLASHPDPEAAASALVEAAVAAGGRDNVTVVVVDTAAAQA